MHTHKIATNSLVKLMAPKCAKCMKCVKNIKPISNNIVTPNTSIKTMPLPLPKSSPFPIA